MTFAAMDETEVNFTEKKNLPYDSVVLFRGEEPLLKHLVLHSVFSKLGTELIAEIALHPSFPSRFKTM